MAEAWGSVKLEWPCGHKSVLAKHYLDQDSTPSFPGTAVLGLSLRVTSGAIVRSLEGTKSETVSYADIIAFP